MGHNVKRFEGTGSGAFSRGLAGARLLVIPELENGNLAPALSPRAVHTIRTYVATGGGLIVFDNKATDLLNRVFGYDVAGSDTTTTGTKTAEAAGTAFGGGPATLPNNNAVRPLAVSSLPAGASTMYANGLDAWVTAFGFGSREIVFLGWDWFQAEPNGVRTAAGCRCCVGR